MLLSLRLRVAQELDLDNYARKLRDPSGKYRWDEARIEEALSGYRKFLLEAASCDDAENVSPSADVDEVWHLHILDTRQYALDCETFFGRFIHHIPSYAPASAGETCGQCSGGKTTMSTCFGGGGGGGKRWEESTCSSAVAREHEAALV